MLPGRFLELGYVRRRIAGLGLHGVVRLLPARPPRFGNPVPQKTVRLPQEWVDALVALARFVIIGFRGLLLIAAHFSTSEAQKNKNAALPMEDRGGGLRQSEPDECYNE